MDVPMEAALRQERFADWQMTCGRPADADGEGHGGRRGLAPEIAEFLQQENEALRATVEELERGLLQASSSHYREVQEAVAALRRVCARLEEENQTRFRQEASALFPLVELQAPQLRALVGELEGDMDRFRRALAGFRGELTIFNTTGELRHLPRLGRELARALRGFLDQEERELLPALQRGLARDDCRWRREVEPIPTKL